MSLSLLSTRCLPAHYYPNTVPAPNVENNDIHLNGTWRRKNVNGWQQREHAISDGIEGIATGFNGIEEFSQQSNPLPFMYFPFFLTSQSKR